MTQILCLVTGGAGDTRRATRLLSALPAEITYHEVDKSRPRMENIRTVHRLVRRQHWDLIFQEGTGIAGGLNLIAAAALWNQPYVLSSGDPIGGFFRTTEGPLHGAIFSVYERLLYRLCTGFIGWSAYLTGKALHLGAPRGMTVEGAVDLDQFQPAPADERTRLRDRYDLPKDHLVCGVVGSLQWSDRQQYCYGLELIETLKRLHRKDVTMLIVGGGDGREKLAERVPASLLDRVVFTGALPSDEIPDVLNAMDVGFISQTLDGLGNYRLTTKLPEYLATGLPVAMSPIPGYFDYVGDTAGWALPAAHPASADFHRQCATWLDDLSRSEARSKRDAARTIAENNFDYQSLTRRFRTFMLYILNLPSNTVSDS